VLILCRDAATSAAHFDRSGETTMRQILSDPRAREKPCLRCGRSLKKVLDDRHCPDCGLSLWISLNPNDSLEWSNARWLRATAQGAWLLAASQLVAFAAYGIALAGYAAAEFQSMVESEDVPYEDLPTAATQAATQPATRAAMESYLAAYHAATSVPVAIAAGLLGVYFLVSAVGLLRLSTHEQRFPDRSKTARLWARIAAGVSAVFGIALIALALPRLRTGWPVHTVSSTVILILCELTFAGSACCAWLILRRVARRAGKGSLAKLCGWLLFLPALAFVKAAPFIGFWVFMLARPLIDLLPLAYLPLAVYLFVRFALLLHRAIPDAERAWGSETRSPAETSV
jgi:hypothetical protein